MYILALQTYLAALVVSIVVYRVSPFHPLAHIPGPIGCKVSKFYMAIIALRGRQHVYIKSLHDRYSSDIVRIGELRALPFSWRMLRVRFPLYEHGLGPVLALFISSCVCDKLRDYDVALSAVRALSYPHSLFLPAARTRVLPKLPARAGSAYHLPPASASPSSIF